MDYTILILVLPVLSFLVLGLTGMFMKHRVARLIGTASLLGVTILSYLLHLNTSCLRIQPTGFILP